jgi:uncharacterized protein YbaP (TraB family)
MRAPTTRRSVPPPLSARLFGSLRDAVAGLLLTLAAATAGAQQSTPAACPPQAQPMSTEQAQAWQREARDRGFLWRIARDGRVSYLYGTSHVARPQWMLPGPRVAKALETSDVIALELDMLDADIQRRLAAGMAADAAQRLPDALAARLSAQVRLACLPQEAMARLAPLLQLVTLQTLAARWDGLDPAYAIDGFLAGYARREGKGVRSLESPELQLALLKGDPQTARQELEHGLEQLERGRVRPMLLRVARVWEQGRDGELSRYAQWCDCADTEVDRAALKRLLDDRNPALAERIDALHEAGHRVFAAVGALHMIGPLGLPALMAQRGFAVRRVDLAH